MLAVFVLSLHICQFGSLYMTIDTDDLIVQLFFVISHCHKSSFTKIPNKNRSDAFNLRPLRNPPPCLKLSFCFSDLGDPMPRRLTLGPDCHHQNAQESIWKKGCRPAETVTEKQWSKDSSGTCQLREIGLTKPHVPRKEDMGAMLIVRDLPFPSGRAKLELCLLTLGDSQLHVDVSLK